MTREELLKIAKPILFNTEMVQVLLEGRKTCTRRVIKFPEGMTGHLPESGATDYIYYPGGIKRPPYQIGDILYVRETFQKLDSSLAADLSLGEYAYVYKASENGKSWEENMENWKWKPNIHMPKKAARIFLKVTDVRVERLLDMSIEDMIREGVKVSDITTNRGIIGYRVTNRFQDLWDSTIKKKELDMYGMEANPWVWVIEFERVEEDLKW